MPENSPTAGNLTVAELLRQGIERHQQGRLAEAQDCYSRILREFPDHFDALHYSGVIAHQNGQSEAALQLINKALAVQPERLDARFNRASIAMVLKNYRQAIEDLDAVVAQAGAPPAAHLLRSNALRKLGLHEQALAACDQAIALQPDNAEIHLNRGIALKELQRHAEAVSAYDRAITLQPSFVAAIGNRGVALAAQDLHEAAVTAYRQALAMQPGLAFIHLHCGISLHHLGRFTEALDSYQSAIRLDPGNAAGYLNLGLVQLRLCQHEAAIASFRRALDIDPSNTDAHVDLGLALAESGLHDEAMRAYDAAIALRPDLRIAHRNKSHLLLLLGNHEQGWPLFEWRSRGEENEARKRRFDCPLWLGDSDIRGKTILLHSEQGLGDTLQFCRFADEIAAQGGRVILEVQAPLVTLLSRMKGPAMVLARGTPLPAFDLHCPMMSLPLAMGVKAGRIAGSGGYLSADPEKIKAWQQRLDPKTRPRIGLIWSGNPDHRNNHNRSIALLEFSRLLTDHCEFFSLQRDIRNADDRRLLAGLPVNAGPIETVQDFSDTAALCTCMDLVISVDTSMAHLTGALGVPVWILLPFNPDWRWMLKRPDTPWYDSARLYRAPGPGTWPEVIARVRNDLQGL